MTAPDAQTSVGHAGEHAVIRRILARLPRPGWLVVPAGDDAAVATTVPREADVLTTDTLVEGVHFDRRFSSLADVGHRAVAVNLSDLAAMGARPRAALLSLALPDALRLEEVDALLDGVLEEAATHGLVVTGGNITRTAAPDGQGGLAPGAGPLVITVTATGTVHPRRVLTRAGARPGDDVYVTGTLGCGRVGLEALRRDPAAAGDLTARYRRPLARVRAGLLLGGHRAASACMDLSDGLADGVRQICAASGVGMLIDSTLVPVDPEVRSWCATTGQDALGAALAGGDDYELLFTARRTARGRLRAVRRAIGDLSLTRIGTVIRDRRAMVVIDGLETALPDGFEHFTTTR